ncbi:MAG: ABC transporter ATP-binding protein [Zhaonellaceae bacterium]|jgi:ABC-2 type transport system ATP-binding protein|nr:ABC transporter ATP-binding protein [Clostridia bacterium]
MSKILEVNNLSKTYKDFTLTDVSFSLEKGYIMGFIGPNGAGKSTTIRLLMNLIKREKGWVRIFGLDYKNHEIEIKNRLGFVYDENIYYEELTIGEMKGLVAPFYSRWNEKLFWKLLKDFDLNPKKKIKDLSRGMKMKFSLAIALSHHADLIIMDEPTSGLDPIVRSELLDILTDYIQDENKAVFLSTHITTDLDRIADYITFINEGKIIFSTNKDELLENYGVVKGAKEDLTPALRGQLIGVKVGSLGFEGMTINKQKVKEVVNQRVLIERPTLEDIMLYTVRGKQNA